MTSTETLITGKNYIGQKLSAKGTTTFKTMNPITNTENETVFTEATPDEIEEAVALAWNVFPSYKNISSSKKAAFLQGIANGIEEAGEELLAMYCQESGLARGRAEGERGRTVGQLRAFAQLVLEGSWVDATIDTAMPDRTPLPKVDIRKMSIPIGPIVVFGASNFPLAFSTAGGDVASALAAGCPVIVKSHAMHAGTGEMVAAIVLKTAKDTGMPNGVFSNLLAAGQSVGVQLVAHKHIKGVGFTGSIQGGRALYDIAAKRPEPIPVFAEMGSINPIVILPSALQTDFDKWTTQIVGSITNGAGQFCTKPGLLIGLKSELLTKFIQTLGEKLQQIAPVCMLHPTIKKNFNAGKELLSSQENVSVVARYEDAVNPNFAQQMLLTVEGKTFLANPLLATEVFGPFSIVVQCENSEELLQIIKGLEGQLTGTILADTTELAASSVLIDALQNRVGRIIFNGVPTGVEVCPSMLHGGPYPASSDSRFTAVGIHAIKRWVRPFSFQNCPMELLPLALQNDNPLKIQRLVNNNLTNEAL